MVDKQQALSNQPSDRIYTPATHSPAAAEDTKQRVAKTVNDAKTIVHFISGTVRGKYIYMCVSQDACNQVVCLQAIKKSY